MLVFRLTRFSSDTESGVSHSEAREVQGKTFDLGSGGVANARDQLSNFETRRHRCRRDLRTFAVVEK